MRKPTWFQALMAGALAVFLTVAGCQSANRSATPAPSSAVSEKRYKERTVRQDAEATEQLGRQQSIQDARSFVRNAATRDPANVLQPFLAAHPEIAAAIWIPGDGQPAHVEGKADILQGKPADKHCQAARQALREGRSHASDIYSIDGHPYFIIAEPVQNTRGKGLILAVSAITVQQVEQLQRKNLRLIPYPAEGRYRIESVKPNTTKDTTVRTGEDNQNASHYAVDEVVVKFRRPLTNRELLQIRKELDMTVVRQIRQTYLFRSKKHRAETLIAYFKKWNPVYVEPHYLYLTNATKPLNDTEMTGIIPNDTLYSKYQWNLPQIETELGWKWNKGSQDMIVAVIDTGVQSDHPDLEGRLVPGINLVDDSQPPEDDVGHGTHVAGIIAAQVNNHEGVAGMTWFTKIMPIKSLDSTGAGSTYAVAQGVIWAADHGADIINMSLGNYAEAQFLHEAIQYAHQKGVLIIAASGNDNTDRPGYPAAYPEVLAVAATDPGGDRAAYSNYGEYIDVAAPGTSIASTYPGSQYAALSGTSMACPHVAALASLVRAANPKLTNEEVMDVLRKSAKDLGEKGKDIYYGYGQIDVRNALEMAVGTSDSRVPNLQSLFLRLGKALRQLADKTAT
jgi:type VII secretion-associated serine protease mycosin